MFVYNELTSRVTRISPGLVSCTAVSLFRKSLVSMRYDLDCRTIGARKWSTNADMRSVALSLADTIGRPGTGRTFLCVFGSRYS